MTRTAIHESSAPRVRRAATASDLSAVRQLLQEYGREFGGPDLGADGFEAELARLPGPYGPPAGRLLLASCGGEPAGCVALRPFDARTAEVKRLFVRPAYRGLGIGGMLVDAIVAEARAAGLARLVLDTLSTMHGAHAAYRSRGFVEIAPYHDHGSAGTLYFERAL